MEKLSSELVSLMNERFGKDCIIALATLDGGLPCVRNVDGFYENGAFYVITHALSRKMQQIRENENVAVAGECFTGHGMGTNLGYFGKAENRDIAEKLKKAFAVWIDNGHNDFSDENTCILCIRLTEGVLYSNGTRHEIDFTAD